MAVQATETTLHLAPILWLITVPESVSGLLAVATSDVGHVLWLWALAGLMARLFTVAADEDALVGTVSSAMVLLTAVAASELGSFGAISCLVS